MADLTHVGRDGKARMVDVGDKPITARAAMAGATVTMQAATLERIRANVVAKGDVLAVARIAAIQAAKRCDELIPLCHSLPLEAVDVEFELDDELPGVRIRATARVSARTGVEMEAMTAASVAALTIYDMCKAADRGMEIGQLCLLRKEGGRSGTWERIDASSVEKAAP
ncbi:MAG: cyclic pyranopterin monophosphate synthase MoaC [Halieaceae bacterium]|nr:cyclic pyranopterin monophosphate synthase MoaC [Halieaceae bacterium]